MSTQYQYLSPVEEKRQGERESRWRLTHLFGVRYHQCRYCGRGIQAALAQPPEVCPKCFSIPITGKGKLPGDIPGR